MSDAVKRDYRSELRAAQAQETRRSIVAAATRLFVEDGYGATTIDAVAEAAGVSRKTVFTAVGGKLDLLKLALDWAVAGDDQAVALSDRAAIRRLMDQRDPRGCSTDSRACSSRSARASGRCTAPWRLLPAWTPPHATSSRSRSNIVSTMHARWSGGFVIWMPSPPTSRTRRPSTGMAGDGSRALRPAGPGEGLADQPIRGLAGRHAVPPTAGLIRWSGSPWPASRLPCCQGDRTRRADFRKLLAHRLFRVHRATLRR